MLCWLISPLQLFLRNQVRESSKQGIQAAWSTPIHHVKRWISRFRGVYRALAASDGELFLILLKGFRPFCNVTRSSVLVVVGVLHLPLHFIIIIIIIIIIIVTITITFIVNIIFVIFVFVKLLSRAVYCSYEVSWPFGFVSFNFFIFFNLIHATTIWCWHTTSILSFGII